MSTPIDPPDPPAPPVLPPPALLAWPRWLIACLLVLLVAAFFSFGWQRYFSLDYIRAHLDLWKQQAEANLPLALGLFFLTYVTVTGLSLPMAAWLSLLSGWLFGPWRGTAVVIVAATCGATLAFLSSRYLFRSAVQRRFGTRLRVINEGVERDGAFYLFALRLVPAVPFFLINLGMGLTPMRVRTFAWITLVGMLPGTFAYVNTGGALRDIQKPGDILSGEVVLALALLGLLPLLLRLLVSFLRKRH